MGCKQFVSFAVALLVSCSFAAPWTGPTTLASKTSLLKPLEAPDADLATFTSPSSAAASRKVSTRSSDQTTTLVQQEEYITYEIVVKASKTKASTLSDNATSHTPVKTDKHSSTLITEERTSFHYKPSKTSEPSYHQNSQTDTVSDHQTSMTSEPSSSQASETVQPLYQTSGTSKAPYHRTSETSKPSYHQNSSTSKPSYHTSTEQRPTQPTFSWMITSIGAQPTTQAKASSSSSGMDYYGIANSMHLDFLSRMGLLPTVAKASSSSFTPGPYWPTTSWVIVEAEKSSSSWSTTETTSGATYHAVEKKARDPKSDSDIHEDGASSGRRDPLDEHMCQMKTLYCPSKEGSAATMTVQAPTPDYTSGHSLVTRNNPEFYPATPVGPLRSYAIWQDWASRQYGYDSEYMNPTNYPLPEPTLQPYTTRSSKHYIFSATIIEPKQTSSTRRFAKTKLADSEPSASPIVIATERELVDRRAPHLTEPMTYTESTLRTLVTPSSQLAERQLVVPKVTGLDHGASRTGSSQDRIAERHIAHCMIIDPSDACIKHYGESHNSAVDYSMPRSVRGSSDQSKVAMVPPTHGKFLEPNGVASSPSEMKREQQHTPSRHRLRRTIVCARFANGRNPMFDDCMQERDPTHDEDDRTASTEDKENSESPIFPRQNSVQIHSKQPEDPWNNAGGVQAKPEFKPIKMGPQLGSIFDGKKLFPIEVNFPKGQSPEYLEAEQNEKDRQVALQACQGKTNNDTVYHACLVDHGYGKPVQVNADPSWQKAPDGPFKKCSKWDPFCILSWATTNSLIPHKRDAEAWKLDDPVSICVSPEVQDSQSYEACMRRLLEDGAGLREGEGGRNRHEETRAASESMQRRDEMYELVDWCYAYRWNTTNVAALEKCIRQHGFAPEKVLPNAHNDDDDHSPLPSLSRRQEEEELSDYLVAYATLCREKFEYFPEKYEQCLDHFGIDRFEVHPEDAQVPKKPPKKVEDELGAP